jgi:hypothetical protein
MKTRRWANNFWVLLGLFALLTAGIGSTCGKTTIDCNCGPNSHITCDIGQQCECTPAGLARCK